MIFLSKYENIAISENDHIKHPDNPLIDTMAVRLLPARNNLSSSLADCSADPSL